nr:carbohydrate porin [Polymorphobacter sp.]
MRVTTATLLAALALLPGTLHAQAAGSSTAPTTDKGTADKPADAAPDAVPERFAFHAQSTVVGQYNTPFHSPYEGPNSLSGAGQLRETFDLTGYIGASPWHGAEVWANGEVDQGFGLRNTLGAAGFPSAEAYKVGKGTPYFRLQRAFVRQAIDLGGEATATAPDLNVLGATHTANRLTLTIGKFSVADVFDQNKYAHDPRGDFLNWTAVDLGTFDYAADAWGYTYGGAAELAIDKWTGRAGLFNLSKIPNSVDLETNFRQFQVIGEIERRVTIGGHPGAIRLNGWLSHGNFASLADAIAYGAAHGAAPDPVPVRRFRDRTGIGIDAEQEVSDTVGVFLRAGLGDGRSEAVEFTDIDRSVSGGVSIKGSGWGRDHDRIGVALIANDISGERKRYLAAGGLGILIGDGRLVHAGPELIGETYYDLAAIGPLHLTADGQLIVNPAYNRDRGPVPVMALRAHAQF